jgi:hypothetical protein
MRPIKFNVGLPDDDPVAALATAQLAEKLGYYSVSIDDHLMPSAICSIMDATSGSTRPTAIPSPCSGRIRRS